MQIRFDENRRFTPSRKRLQGGNSTQIIIIDWHRSCCLPSKVSNEVTD